jgi:hypothetical protein
MDTFRSALPLGEFDRDFAIFDKANELLNQIQTTARPYGDGQPSVARPAPEGRVGAGNSDAQKN